MVGAVQQTDSAQLLEQSTLQGDLQSSENVALSELIPVIVSSGTAIFIAPPDSVLLSESVSIIGSITVVESVQASDLAIVSIFPATNIVVYARSGNNAV